MTDGRPYNIKKLFAVTLFMYNNDADFFMNSFIEFPIDKYIVKNLIKLS